MDPTPLLSSKSRLAAALLLLGAMAGPAHALDATQRQVYARALADNDAGRFGSAGMASAYPAPGGDAVADAVVQWDRLRRDAYPASFFELAAFLRSHRGWPAEATLRSRAEQAITASTPMADRIGFFQAFPPQSGDAKFRYAEALLGSGRSAEARALVREAWTRGALSSTVEAELMARFGGDLTPADHAARVDWLLWQGSVSPALRLQGLLPPDRQALAAARIALRQNAPDASQRLAAVPAELRRDPGLIFDRVQAMRGTDMLGARRLLADARIDPGTATDAVAWLKLHAELARASLRDQHHALGYAIADGHNAFPLGRPLSERSLRERQAFIDVEGTAGWIALKHLNRPEDALRHFDSFGAAVLTPVSQSRADYWAGRAAEAAGRQSEARRYYARAGTHPDQFYGQLALERLGQAIRLPQSRPVLVTGAQRQSFEASELVRATRLLGELGERGRQTMFMRALVERAETPQDKQLLVDLGNSIGRRDLGVLAGVAARSDGMLELFSSAYPTLSNAAIYDGNWTMVHAITRQESRFDRAAISSAGARGLMQLMPGTAREQAGKLGQSYDFARLTDDETYNVLLGSSYYQRVLDGWGGNHVLAVASYNAGPGNVRKWIAANGDPRDPNVDVVEWIEAIPIEETRNYVQRVLENAVVYDLMHPRAASTARYPLSAYLGRRTPG